MFSFALGEFGQALKYRLFIGECMVTLLFALQISLARAFEFDQQDKVLDLMRSYPIRPSAIFLAKFLVCYATCMMIAIPGIFFAGMFTQSLTPEHFGVFVGAVSLGLIGLVALGVLLTALTLVASSRQVLYPILFFPLTTPVLLSICQFVLMNQSLDFSSKSMNWLLLLGIFNVIYFSLSLGFFQELFETEE
jgi:heme exporter protein B